MRRLFAPLSRWLDRWIDARIRAHPIAFASANDSKALSTALADGLPPFVPQQELAHNVAQPSQADDAVKQKPVRTRLGISGCRIWCVPLLRGGSA